MLKSLKIGTKIGISFALSLATLATIGLISYQSTNELIETSARESHTYQVLSELEDLNLQLTNAETGQRGYIITGEQRYLEPYNAAIEVLNQKVNELQRLTADNLNQQNRLDILQPLLTERMAVMKDVIELRQSQGLEASQKAVLTDQGKQLMDNIQKVIQAMKNEENALLKQRSQRAQAAAQKTIATIVYSIPLFSLILALIGFVLTRHISAPLKQVSDLAEKMADGNLLVSLPDSDRQDEIGVLTRTFNQMIVNLRNTNQKNDEQNWLKSNLAEFTQMLQGHRNLETASRLILSNLAPLVGASQGVFYFMDSIDNEPVLKLLSSYAYKERKNLANQFRLGEGLVGQCALEKQRILLTEVPSDYIRISSGLGEAPPLNIIVLPILFETQVSAVIELASFGSFSHLHLTFLEQLSEILGVFLNNIASQLQTQRLLEESVALTEELQNQQEELQHSNQRLEEQAQELEESQFLVKQSNEELQQLNEELEEKAELLEFQNREVARKNQEVEQARQSLEQKAEQLELSSKYKSEFLANMSHELRTPLNSLLILARLLADNSLNNLTDKQVEYSRTIYSAGTDLLELINDILDLAKIESGTMSLDIEQIALADLETSLEQTFRQVAHNKELSFTIERDEKLPPTIYNDSKRLQQVLKNLLANAFKFTEQGGVKLQIGIATKADEVDNAMIAFAVSDTGIGIPEEKQKIIFEAFQQADGTTSRKYGGTGLGLSISRELAQLLGGRIEIVSQPGQGSTFTLFLPRRHEGKDKNSLTPSLSGPISSMRAASLIKEVPLVVENRPTIDISPSPKVLVSLPNDIPDDREIIQPGDRILLIIEDDDKFARILLDMAREQGFKTIVALQSKQGLALAQEFKPDAIMLDIHMPEMDGWTVLDRLKHKPDTRHIPVHILSVDERQQRGLQLGAITYLQKPVSPEALTQVLTEIKGFIERQVKNLLIVEDDPVQAQSIIELIGNGDVHSTAVGTGAEALSILRSHHFDCMVLDLGLPDMSGFTLIEQIKQESRLLKLPIIVYTGKELSRQEETQLRGLAETIIIKNVRSPERLLDETALFLHRVQANLPPPKRQILEQLHQNDPVLANRTILIVDDDLRNIFALTSFLESYQMQVLFAENGRDGIEKLQTNPEINIVLMDIMMPEMDGYETTRAIRQQQQFRSLPIIALTAKAMPGDREKCIEAGASDYITKPVDTEQLLSLLRVWLYK
ncbi:multi-sensor hybrid histidine kinase [Nostoc commune NIES-4072]|uniref:Circadian input-output histidine kinase CikA n=1 Tax=Nostoc commune NIES-4072 TaxID=2005467 RepID=A0A2R5FR04_NOSCO|nr:response regulator [Nostoc commune]BBD68291.1 multi-sensor hybrid histidine kinase [Nostoc commune HK-02]GBG20715.1 multi-sensor hybrid histidine kinase [Nostoc commune NIES-4072]